MSPASPEPRPRYVIRCYPKAVADLECIADVLPELLRAAAAELRAAGLEDLRTTIDVMIDEQRTMIRRCAGAPRSTGEGDKQLCVGFLT